MMGLFKATFATQSRYDSINFDNLRFGVYFSDHIYVSDYNDGAWTQGEIVPYGPFEIEPAMCSLHYGQALFEGLKAFRSVKGGVNLFRPRKNAERLNKSAERICIPPFDTELLIEAMKELCRIDYKFIPTKRGNALYIRPVAFGTGNFLGVHESAAYRLIIMTSPVGSYYPEGLNPVRIMVSDTYVRAVKGGTGNAKVAGNYAASLLASKQARALGYSQVLWLDGISHKFVDEVGAMNIMFVIDDELITPSLENGTILPGVTRDSILTLAREWGMQASEKSISIEEVLEAHSLGKLTEVFGTGTAAVISPVGVLGYKGKNYVINNNKIGHFTQKFYNAITGIQYGEIEDTHGWIVHIDV